MWKLQFTVKQLLFTDITDVFINVKEDAMNNGRFGMAPNKISTTIRHTVRKTHKRSNRFTMRHNE